MQKMDAGGAIRVAKADELYDLTSRGWKLIFITQEVEPAVKRFPLMKKDQYGHEMRVDEERVDVVTVTKYVLQLDENQAHAIAQKELQAANYSLEHLRRECNQREHEIGVIKQQLETANATGMVTKQDFNEAALNADRYAKLARKLEVDIGKIREAIGSKQMAEILGAK